MRRSVKLASTGSCAEFSPRVTSRSGFSREALYPVVDQVADKVCATMDAYPGGKRSSRVKDLVDLIVLAHTQVVELAGLREAIDAKRTLSGIAPFVRIDIPDAWALTWPTTAKGVPMAAGYSFVEAMEIVTAFLAPALDERTASATWDPGRLAWV